MNGGVSGEVYGEVINKHLTIGKSDKQSCSAQFGEVLPCLQQNFFCVYCPILCKSFLWVLNIIPGWPEQASEMASEHVADTF